MSDRVLVVGGTGLIGSTVAEHLAERGDAVTIMARRPAGESDPPGVAGMPRLVGDYAEDDLDAVSLDGFDAVVFAAGADIRHIPADVDETAFWDRTQGVGVPRFAEAARRAGVGRFVQIGSYYHQLHPEWAESIPYVAARKAADERTRALSDDGFAAITVNPPSIVGAVPGRSLRGWGRMISWVRGELDAPEVFAPPGGTNYMSARSLAQAVAGALANGEGGRAYLVGDANLTYRAYFQLIADVAGSDEVIVERDAEQPFQPDRFIVQGRGRVIAYEPDAADTALLGYARDDVESALERIVHASDGVTR
ncbi:NAD-dependent epimerase/dehydratase family protein [Microbacterium sp. ASV49]|uniref:NAD(P)H-binding protein n=1 Tax=Microbacterium candidum TaxID=3041922 RepID=A0ABT7MXX3_9MICO|nr:NAD-dependent epimerase/dehydratase family protein [Microbacterium sp. ASV49]MDL9979302.1 NAD(P)H-binding protein [Microbacterium sp. ASV49]